MRVNLVPHDDFCESYYLKSNKSCTKARKDFVFKLNLSDSNTFVVTKVESYRYM